MNEKISYDDFFEGALDRLDQSVRQSSKETCRAGDEKLLIAAQHELPRGGIERREKFIRRQDIRAREGVQQRRFAGVGVTDDRACRQRYALPLPALDIALLDDVLELALEMRDAVTDDA